MRILQLIDIGFEAGGAEKSVRLIRDCLRTRGHTVMVVSTDANLGEHVPFADVLVPAVSGSWPRRLRDYHGYAQTRRVVGGVVQRFKPDLVHLHAVGEFSPSVFDALRQVPTVLTVHGPEEFTGGLLRWQLPASAYKGGSYELRDLTAKGRARLAYLRYVQRPAYLKRLGGVRSVITPSEFMADAIGPDFPGREIKVINNGIDLPARQAPSGSSELLYVGRLERVKGVHVLLAAFAIARQQAPRARLTVVGDGSQSTSLAALAEALKIGSDVRWTGWLPEAELRKEYTCATALVIPSVWPENFPTVALEAMATGRAIVASRVGGIRELVREGVTGHLVKPGNAAELASALVSVVSDPEAAARMGEHAADASASYGVGRFVDALELEYRRVVAR